ncbi:hypothetical protein DFP72DRAFT_911344 [Ephemerocybe angulata]|uniref:Uncharacterized protein n=1 Tax=Ephemerocybe angulata TaxID=980116 RepID=A0A8H6LZU4_9AGAR|nr:hypothetical protein DFP72DRAFT_911344 [Tulosesus angulatus]
MEQSASTLYPKLEKTLRISFFLTIPAIIIGLAWNTLYAPIPLALGGIAYLFHWTIYSKLRDARRAAPAETTDNIANAGDDEEDTPLIDGATHGSIDTHSLSIPLTVVISGYLLALLWFMTAVFATVLEAAAFIADRRFEGVRLSAMALFSVLQSGALARISFLSNRARKASKNVDLSWIYCAWQCTQCRCNL